MPSSAAATVELVSTVVAALPRNFGPYATLMLSGFVIGILGHLTRQRWLVALGVMLIAIGVLLLPLALTAETSDEPSPPPPPTLTGALGG